MYLLTLTLYAYDMDHNAKPTPTRTHGSQRIDSDVDIPVDDTKTGETATQISAAYPSIDSDAYTWIITQNRLQY